MDFQISTAQEGSKVSPGILRIYYAETSDFTTISTPPASPTDEADKLVIATAHTPVDSEHGFREGYISQEKSELEMTGVGDVDGRATKNDLKIFIPGDDKHALHFVYKNPKLLVLVEKSPCGGSEYYQVGSKCTPAKITDWKFMTKKIGGNESKGIEITIGNVQDRPLLYTASIPLAE